MIPSRWIEEIAEEIGLATALPADSLKNIGCVLETDLKRIVQLSIKFQKRTKQSRLSMEHVNLALTSFGGEAIYGLCGRHNVQDDLMMMSADTPLKATSESLSLVEILRRPLPPVPLAPDLCIHWLGIYLLSILST